MNLGKQQVRECPCNDPICKQWVVWPAFSRPESATTDKAWCEEVVRRLNHFEVPAVCEWSEIEDGSGIYNTCRPGEEFHLPEGLELWPHCHFCGRRIEVVGSEGERL